MILSTPRAVRNGRCPTVLMSAVLIICSLIAVLAFSLLYSHSSSSDVLKSALMNHPSARDALDSRRYLLPSRQGAKFVDSEAQQRAITTISDNGSATASSYAPNRQLSKHLKQLKEDQPPDEDDQVSSQPLAMTVDYSQFSCDSMNDPNLLEKLQERWKNEQSREQSSQQAEMKQKKKEKKAHRKNKEGEHDDNNEEVNEETNVDEVHSTVTNGSAKDDTQDDVTSLQTPLLDKCQFAKTCNDGEGVGFGAALFCSTRGHGVVGNNASSSSSTTAASDNNTSSSTTTAIIINTLTILLLLTTLLLLFRLLNSTTDEFFSPGLEHFSLQLGLPPRFAGVTLLALGNGAPDVAATMNATLDSHEGYLMALGELTGTSMFVSGVILGVIVSLNDGRGGGGGVEESKATTTAAVIKRGVACQGPLLRDIAVLSLVCVVAMSYLERGVVECGGLWCTSFSVVNWKAASLLGLPPQSQSDSVYKKMPMVQE